VPSVPASLIVPTTSQITDGQPAANTSLAAPAALQGLQPILPRKSDGALRGFPRGKGFRHKPFNSSIVLETNPAEDCGAGDSSSKKEEKGTWKTSEKVKHASVGENNEEIKRRSVPVVGSHCSSKNALSPESVEGDTSLEDASMPNAISNTNDTQDLREPHSEDAKNVEKVRRQRLDKHKTAILEEWASKNFESHLINFIFDETADGAAADGGGKQGKRRKKRKSAQCRIGWTVSLSEQTGLSRRQVKEWIRRWRCKKYKDILQDMGVPCSREARLTKDEFKGLVKVKEIKAGEGDQ